MKSPSHILLTPRITEKGAYLSEHGAYVFNVSPQANKREIAQAVKAIYKVTPRKVTVARVPGKSRMTRGTNRIGKSTSGKKAYVYLAKGETIEFI
ncbi:50S ribosomal protein L23 [Candidatus Adlerbacteria bacterium RIFCSPHIGHO2_02_FULL_52_17]|uniref:Large ribosomal subunit protein uL23 n=1 Tax=Candidatus Adlerbacteria bacterium RIFCSPHIGHO2_02_FULL_52_17 TaxID=1797240 RepID=A0A1F4XQQ5_9BACT|nr:MAG: 50S ribosomal protein L23 [Candidatus Adlerbacteria bacterium RIFCSPHIGHO2_02_FULL_52_17]